MTDKEKEYHAKLFVSFFLTDINILIKEHIPNDRFTDKEYLKKVIAIRNNIAKKYTDEMIKKQDDEFELKKTKEYLLEFVNNELKKDEIHPHYLINKTSINKTYETDLTNDKKLNTFLMDRKKLLITYDAVEKAITTEYKNLDELIVKVDKKNKVGNRKYVVTEGMILNKIGHHFSELDENKSKTIKTNIIKFRANIIKTKKTEKITPVSPL